MLEMCGEANQGRARQLLRHQYYMGLRLASALSRTEAWLVYSRLDAALQSPDLSRPPLESIDFNEELPLPEFFEARVGPTALVATERQAVRLVAEPRHRAPFVALLRAHLVSAFCTGCSQPTQMCVAALGTMFDAFKGERNPYHLNQLDKLYDIPGDDDSTEDSASDHGGGGGAHVRTQGASVLPEGRLERHADSDDTDRYSVSPDNEGSQDTVGSEDSWHPAPENADGLSSLCITGKGHSRL